MALTLPSLPKSLGNLRHVFSSAISATLGEQSKFGFPVKRHYCVILVDGLGFENLLHRRGHARFLSSTAESQRSIKSSFPSTTAANITSFATGLHVADHGFMGHQVFDRQRDVKINLLTGWSEEDSTSWQTNETLSEMAVRRGLQVNAIGPSEYQDSGFTRATMRAVNYQIAESIEGRFEVARSNFTSLDASVTYLYVPELDKQAHRTGWLSAEWTNWLELLDLSMRNFVTGLPKHAGVVLTSDHGVIDSPPDKRYLVDSMDDLAELEWFGGDSRASYLYLKDGADPASVGERLSHNLSGIARAFESRRLVEAGYFGQTAIQHASRLPELVLLAENECTLFHSTMSKRRSIEMVAHHGGASKSELSIPLLQWVS